ncbi:hypothetical protein [Mesorhizobium sp. J428]|uniref:hypothetical protein n=1 Tax=Mesorhizobium sp. J428 TaxID=2898440 RepID=UPI002150CAE0|nr:hypothetical protein [Mesorhizobium sp. J428]MCR5859750.1 hypothetical protein [Mesorhizobium sp. J428]
MALWQFKCFLVSATDTLIHGVAAISLSEGQVADAKLRVDADDLDRFFERLSDLLPEKASWDAALRIWGDEKTDDIQVWLDGGEIAEVQLRLDMRDPSIDLVDGLCRLAAAYECVFLTPDGRIIRPNKDRLEKVSGRSAAADFSRDPAAFLAR